jgi:hypothetical protein
MKWCVALTVVSFLSGPAAAWCGYYAVTDQGWIVGSGTSPLGQTHAFLLMPVPEPSALVLLGVGGACMAALAWRWWKSQNALCPVRVACVCSTRSFPWPRSRKI